MSCGVYFAGPPRPGHPASTGSAGRQPAVPQVTDTASDTPLFIIARVFALCLICFLSTSGCTSQPAAPLLSDAPVYRSASEGFRFLVPEGWTQTSSSVLPPGKLTDEVFLVRYNVQSAEIGAVLYVICMADDKSLDLEKYHSEESFRVGHWDAAQPKRTLEINKVPAERIIYKALDDKREMTKHVTCFRRNDRIYSFVGLYFSSDAHAPQQIERAVDSVIWNR